MICITMTVYVSCLVLLLLVESSTAFTRIAVTKEGGIKRSRLFSLPVTASPNEYGVQDTTVTGASSTSTSSSEPDADAINNLRPFHQNWWPVSALNALDTSKPNGLQVLGKHLVAVWNQADSTWTVLDDRCSHRFAPLSEGRVLHPEEGSQDPSCVQCAYHGWQVSQLTFVYSSDDNLCFWSEYFLSKLTNSLSIYLLYGSLKQPPVSVLPFLNSRIGSTRHGQ